MRIPVRNYERVVDDVKRIDPAGAATSANHSTEIYWFAGSAAAAAAVAAMYFE